MIRVMVFVTQVNDVDLGVLVVLSAVKFSKTISFDIGYA